MNTCKLTSGTAHVVLAISYLSCISERTGPRHWRHWSSGRPGSCPSPPPHEPAAPADKRSDGNRKTALSHLSKGRYTDFTPVNLQYDSHSFFLNETFHPSQVWIPFSFGQLFKKKKKSFPFESQLGAFLCSFGCPPSASVSYFSQSLKTCMFWSDWRGEWELAWWLVCVGIGSICFPKQILQKVSEFPS